MIELFKKGQIVPKRLNIVSCRRKQRQHIVFGVDCVYDHHLKIINVIDCDGPLIDVSAHAERVKTGNGTFKKMKACEYSFSACRLPKSESGHTINA